MQETQVQSLGWMGGPIYYMPHGIDKIGKKKKKKQLQEIKKFHVCPCFADKKKIGQGNRVGGV